MYITCEQCSTIFRLDESLLKPTGSKVRCSQCRYIFVAYPPQPDTVAPAGPGAAAVAEMVEPPQDTFDQELEGIDLAELDSILEQEQPQENSVVSEFVEDVEIDEPVEFDEADLDLDFESALEDDFDDTPAESPAAEISREAPEAIEEDIDLDMDFELDDSVREAAPAAASAPSADPDADDIDLDMDFELEADLEESAEAVPQQDDVLEDDIELGEDVELALDEFEDVLGHADDAAAVDSLLEKAPAEDNEAAAVETAATDADDGDIDLGDLGALLDADDDDDESVSEVVDEDMELSLADDDIEPEETPAVDAGGATTPEAVTAEDEGDDLDLTGGLADLLDDDGLDGGSEDDADEPEDVELSLDDDLDLDLADDTDLLIEDDASDVAAGSEDVELSLDDDLDLSDDTDLLIEDEALDADAESEDIDLSLDDDLELELEDESGPSLVDDAATSEAEADKGEEVLDFDGLDSLLDEPDLAVEDESSEDEELSLEEDLELDLSDDAEAPAADVSRDEFDLSDFEDLLSEDDTADADELSLDADDTSDLQLPSEEEEDFDLGDLDGMLEGSAEDAEADVEDADLSLDDDMELSLDDELNLDMESDTPAAEDAAPAEEDDFDLSMLDSGMLDEDDDDTSDKPQDDVELSLDDDMELSLDEEPEMQAADAADAEESVAEESIDDIEDLDFELDAEFEDKPIFKSGDGEEDDGASLSLQEESPDEGLDLTDIEKMLEDDTIVPDVEDASEGVELDLDSSGAEKWADELDGDLGLGDDDEIDLSEIEDAINSADQEGEDEEFSDGVEDLELDLDIEEPAEKETEPESLELDLELEEKKPAPQPDSGDGDEMDLGDLDLSMDRDQPDVQIETVDGGDIQLEFQVDTKDPDDFEFDGAETVQASETTSGFGDTTGFPIDDETFSGEETITTELDKEEPAAKTAPKLKKKKGGASKFLIILLVLAALGGGGFFGYDYVIKNNIQIPYLSDYINPEAKDPAGILQLSTTNINGKFIENEVAGRLFVITGKVRNGYSLPRKLIRLRGNLYTKGKTLAKTEHTFAGLVMADQELSSKTLAEIKKRLNTTTGQDAAITVAAGKTLPFMVVFAELPPDLDEYIIELVTSIKAQ